MFDILSIGDSTIDTFLVIDDASLSCDLKKENCKICFNFADKIPINFTTQSIGGNACNSAVSFAKIGLKSAIITELGDDLNGLVIKNELERKKVNTDYLKLIKGGETRYSVVLNYQGERTIFSYHVKRKYDLKKIPDTKWIYYTSLGQNFGNTQKKLIAHLKKNPEIKLAVNPGSYQIKYGLEEIKKIFPLAQIVFLNKEEAERISGKKGNLKSIFNSLRQMGIKIVVITDGENGSYVSDGQAMYHMSIFNIKAKAKTGAGDAFASAFLVAYMKNKTIKEALKYGTANAGGVIGEYGAQKGLLTWNAMEEMIKKNNKVNPESV
ncbi:MAG: carbohydrate kinase family protein [Patescibacteria group bacterium]